MVIFVLNNRKRKRLEDARYEALSKAINNVLSGKKNPRKNDLEHFEEIEKVIKLADDLSRRNRRINILLKFAWIFFVLIGSGIIYFLVATRCPENRIRLEVECRSLGIKPLAAIEFGNSSGPILRNLRISGVSELQFNNLGIDSTDSFGNLQFSITKSHIVAYHVGIRDSSSFTIGANGDSTFIIRFLPADEKSYLLVNGNGLFNWETMSLSTGNMLHALVPFSGAESWPLEFKGTTDKISQSSDLFVTFEGSLLEIWSYPKALDVRSLNFDKKSVSGSEFLSSILGGKIYLLDMDKIYEISEADHLYFSDVEGRLTKMVVDNAIKIIFEGKVNHINLGNTFIQDLRPNRLLYYSKNETQHVVIATCLFLLGFIRSIFWHIPREPLG